MRLMQAGLRHWNTSRQLCAGGGLGTVLVWGKSGIFQNLPCRGISFARQPTTLLYSLSIPMPVMTPSLSLSNMGSVNSSSEIPHCLTQALRPLYTSSCGQPSLSATWHAATKMSEKREPREGLLQARPRCQVHSMKNRGQSR